MQYCAKVLGSFIKDMQFPEFCTKKARKCDTQEILSP